ncbi:MAG: cytochrome P450 [Ilumatobacteraceae bacterium]
MSFRSPRCEVPVDALIRDHHNEMSLIRAIGDVVWVPVLDGWVVSTREVAVAVMRDAATFTVDDPRFSTAQVIGPSMLSLDGAEHSRHRDPFVAAYRPTEVVSRSGDRIISAATELVEALAPTGYGELRRGLAGPLAVAVVAMSLGLDDLSTTDLLGWYDRIVAAVEVVSQGGPVDPGALDAFGDLGVALQAAVRQPGSVLADAATLLSSEELVANAAVFLFGGIETSEGMTANLLGHLLAAPDQLAAVAADRSLIDAAVEESLRLEPAAARVDRYATCDVEIGGASVRAGDLVIVSLSAANRDPGAYPDPDRFDVRRVNSRSHLAFAQGPHACIGAQLARMQTRAAVVAVLDRLPEITLAEPVEMQGLVFRKARAVDATWRAVGVATQTSNTTSEHL